MSVRMTEDEIWAFVTDAHTGILTTLRRDGVPIAMPIWFACLDRRIYVRTRGKKLDRIRHDPRSSFLVETGERWAELQAVHLTGRAAIIQPSEDLYERFEAEIGRKYASFRTRQREMPAQTAAVYREAISGFVEFVPDSRVLNWDNRKLGLA